MKSMNKKYLSVILLLLASSGAVSAAAELISDKQGVGVDKTEVDAFLKPAPVKIQLDLLKKKADFQQKLQELYLTKAIADSVKKAPLAAEDQAELDTLLQRFYFGVKIKQLSEQDLPDFEPLAALEYKAHKDKYVEPEQVAVEHILLDTREKYKEKEALKLAKTLIAELKKGANFAELALKYSDDPSVKENKGQLGLFSKGKMLKAFEDSAYKLKLNEISAPVETQYGYHVLRKYDQKPQGIRPYAAVKEEIIAQLKSTYVQGRLTDFYAKTKTDNGMKFDDAALDAYITEKTKQLESEMKPAVVAK